MLDPKDRSAKGHSDISGVWRNLHYQLPFLTPAVAGASAIVGQALKAISTILNALNYAAVSDLGWIAIGVCVVVPAIAIWKLVASKLSPNDRYEAVKEEIELRSLVMEEAGFTAAQKRELWLEYYKKLDDDFRTQGRNISTEQFADTPRIPKSRSET